ncbi:MAG: glycosyltransferase family 39 protein [Defluviitaleaceae bacterium]|nr:glycosyltransferase family 39 protein [Defluviitaleaceae bacterium]MCL2239323.1 glycosyltransferase family 39 protein [Defluviitaleaceae bacterium]
MSKPYVFFCVINIIFLFLFSLFSLFTGVRASFIVAVVFLGVYFTAVFFYALFGAKTENDAEIKKWLYISAVIILGLFFRIISWYIFSPEQVQDFGRAHSVYLFIAQHGPFHPAATWADYHSYQFYYARFPAWFSFFAITRLMYSIFGVDIRLMVVLNYFMYLFSAFLLYLSVKRFFSFAVAFCAVALFALNPILVVWSTITSPDHFYIFLFMGLFYFISRHYSEEGKGSYLFPALAAGLAALTDFFKPIALMFLIAYFCVEILFINKLNIKLNYKKWIVFTLTFLSVFFAGHALVRLGIQRTFRIQTVSSLGMYMAFSWMTDEAGNHSHAEGFAKFEGLMETHGNNLVVVQDEMSRYAREFFRENRHRLPILLFQKAQMGFGDEGVLGWVMTQEEPEQTAAFQRTLGPTLWVGFTVHIFVLFSLAAVGAFFGIYEKKNRRALVFLMTTVIGYTLILLIGIVQARYRILLYPQLTVLAAYGLCELIKKRLSP